LICILSANRSPLVLSGSFMFLSPTSSPKASLPRCLLVFGPVSTFSHQTFRLRGGVRLLVYLSIFPRTFISPQL
jgi:hypothetical protein